MSDNKKDEVKILEKYLPTQLDEVALKQIISKLIAEKGKRKKEVQEAYDKYMELSNKYDSDYCSNTRLYDFPFNFFEL
jgi:uncharacterized protein YqeY